MKTELRPTGRREMAATAAPATRPASMADVAVLAGVSHQTVSRVINGSPHVRTGTRMRVLAAIDALSYRPNAAARLLVTNRSGRIGMLTMQVGLYGPTAAAVAVQEAGRRAGFDVFLIILADLTQTTIDHAVGRLRDHAVEGVVLAVTLEPEYIRSRFHDRSIPTVTVGGAASASNRGTGIDQQGGARVATEHLLCLGHRSVAHIAGPSTWAEASERISGWRQAHEVRGRKEGPILRGDWSAASGYSLGLELACNREVTAVFCANDQMALGLLRAASETGRLIPDTLSVVGFDDIPEAEYLVPPLTTMRQDFTAAGARAIENLRAAIAGESVTANALVPRLVARGTTTSPGHTPAQA